MSDNIDLKQWLEIRDLLFCQNYVEQDVKRALALAVVCKHPDALWLTAACAGKDVNTKEEARDVFLSLGDDPRALCFAGYRDLMRRSAEMGYAFAEAMMALTSEGKERFDWAQRAALQGERDGFYMLGYCFQYGVDCEKDLGKAKENFLRAASLNSVSGMICVGRLMDESDPERWMWLGRAAAKGSPHWFLVSFSSTVISFKTDPSFAPAVFAIGRALNGHVVAEKRQIFGSDYLFDKCIGPATEAISFFIAQCAAARKAVDTWCLVALRIGNSLINKDMRKMIGLHIWNARTLANYNQAKRSNKRNKLF